MFVIKYSNYYIMQKNKLIPLLVFALFAMVTLPNCKSTQKTTTTKTTPEAKAVAAVSYERDVLPIINNHCSPCHVSPDGRKAHLDNYEGAKEHIREMIRMVKLAPTDPDFMPFKSKKAPLNAEQIATLEKWMAEGMAK